MEYEINYLVLQSKTNELKSIREQIKKNIEEVGGKISEEREFLKRKLAYEINHERFGFFTVLRFILEEEKGDSIKKIQNKLNFFPNVVRFIIINAEELPSLNQLDYKDSKKEEINGKKILKPEEVEELLAKRKVVAKIDKDKSIKKEVEDKKEEEGMGIKDQDESISSRPENENKEEGDEKEEEKTEDNKKDDKKDNKISLDDLDEKLDEILNI